MKRIFFLLILVLSYILIDIDDCQAQALVRYSKQGNITKAKELLNKEADSTTLNAALFTAAGEGHTEIMKLLIENGANINSCQPWTDFDKTTNSVLTNAVVEAQIEAIKLLLKYGANLDAGTGYKPLEYAFFCYNSKYFGKIVDPNTWNDPSKLIEIVKLLLDNGADPDNYRKNLKGAVRISFNGASVIPIFEAIRTRKIEVVKLLVEHGADVNIEGFSRTMHPLFSWYVNIEEYLDRPLTYALMGDRIFKSQSINWDGVAIARYLIDSGAKIPQNMAIFTYAPEIYPKRDLVQDTIYFPYLPAGYHSLVLQYRAVHETSSTKTTYIGSADTLIFTAKPSSLYLIWGNLLPGNKWTSNIKEIEFDSKEINK